MGFDYGDRAVFGQELQDADFTWLIQTYRERRPEALLVDTPGCALVLLPAYSPQLALPGPSQSSQQLLPALPVEERSSEELNKGDSGQRKR